MRPCSSTGAALSLMRQLQAGDAALHKALCARPSVDGRASVVEAGPAEQLERMQKQAASLALDLEQLRARRRQWEGRAKAAPVARGNVSASWGRGAGAGIDSLAKMRAELMELQSARQRAVTELRQLKQQRLRVRPKDIQVIPS